MKNGTYVVKLDLRDEYEIAELHNGKWHTFRSLQQKFSEKDIIRAEIVFDNPESPDFSVIYHDQDKVKDGIVLAKKIVKVSEPVLRLPD